QRGANPGPDCLGRHSIAGTGTRHDDNPGPHLTLYGFSGGPGRLLTACHHRPGAVGSVTGTNRRLKSLSVSNTDRRTDRRRIKAMAVYRYCWAPRWSNYLQEEVGTVNVIKKRAGCRIEQCRIHPTRLRKATQLSVIVYVRTGHDKVVAGSHAFKRIGI